LSAVRAIRVFVLAMLASASTACLVVSLQPAYDPDTIAFEPALIGVWASEEDNVTVTIDRAEWHSYHLAIDDDGKVTRLSGRLTRVGEMLLLDVAPLDGTDIAPMEIAVHGLYRVDVGPDTLEVGPLDYDRFYSMAKAGEAGLGLVLDARKNAVITASTSELRRWLLAHAADAGLFGERTVLKRKAAP
jgi:hypothetical protein